MPIKRQT